MKKALSLLLVTATILSLSACGPKAPVSTPPPSGDNPASSVTAETSSLSLCNTQPDSDVETLALYECEKRIETATDGNFAIEVYPNSSMGDTDDVLEQAIQGMAVLTITDPGRLADYIPDYGILAMPYMIPSTDDIDAITLSSKVKDWENDFGEFGVKVLTSNWYGGARQFVCGKEINTPQDLKGLKIRTMGSDICQASINAMGAVATAMSMSEVYSGIEQKAIDGCENQSTSTYALRLYELESYLNKTGHFMLLGVPATGTTYFDSLSPAYQQLLCDTFTQVGTEYQQTCIDMEKTCEADMVKEGMTIHDVDPAPFVEAVEPLYAQFGFEALRNEIYTEIGIQ